jgi:gamma-glutamylcyclotransferase (GGCT)/AIG2-like uncharacterized protein YtfP
MPSKLFVYGTLRKDNRNSMSQLLAGKARLLGRARMQGRLFDLGEYPGLVLSRDPDSWVYGEVYALDNPDETLACLDDYEGCGPNDSVPHEFERIRNDVILESGERDIVWVYVYRGSTAGKREILSGDYLKEAL